MVPLPIYSRLIKLLGDDDHDERHEMGNLNEKGAQTDPPVNNVGTMTEDQDNSTTGSNTEDTNSSTIGTNTEDQGGITTGTMTEDQGNSTKATMTEGQSNSAKGTMTEQQASTTADRGTQAFLEKDYADAAAAPQLPTPAQAHSVPRYNNKGDKMLNDMIADGRGLPDTDTRMDEPAKKRPAASITQRNSKIALHQCDQCLSTFTTKSALKRHDDSMHKDEATKRLKRKRGRPPGSKALKKTTEMQDWADSRTLGKGVKVLKTETQPVKRHLRSRTARAEKDDDDDDFSFWS
jgi:hypothetical protein